MNKNDFLKNLNSPESLFAEFLSIYKKEKVFCFVEGYDWAFYYSVYKLYVSKDLEPFKCFGKKNVLELQKKINTKKYHNCYFIVDRDYEVLESSQDDLYITPGYSVENFYFDRKFFYNLISSEMKLAGNGYLKVDVVNSITGILVQRLEDFLNVFLEFNALLATVKGEESINYQNIDVTAFVDISLDTITKKYDVNSLLSSFNCKKNFDYYEKNYIENKKRLSICLIKSCRGKFLVQFFVKIMRVLIAELECENNRFSQQKFRYSKIIAKETFISDYSSYATCPECLKNFVKRAG